MEELFIFLTSLLDNEILSQANHEEGESDQRSTNNTIGISGFSDEEDLPDIGQNNIQETHGGSRTSHFELKTAVDGDLGESASDSTANDS